MYSWLLIGSGGGGGGGGAVSDLVLGLGCFMVSSNA